MCERNSKNFEHIVGRYLCLKGRKLWGGITLPTLILRFWIFLAEFFCNMIVELKRMLKNQIESLQNKFKKHTLNFHSSKNYSIEVGHR